MSLVHTVAQPILGGGGGVVCQPSPSSSSATFITGIVGPKVSSRMQAIEWIDVQKNRCGSKNPPVAFPPVRDRGPACDCILDVVSHDIDLLL